MPEVAKIALAHSRIGDEDDALSAVTADRMDWDKFRVFAAVARTGSFTKAASELGLQQSTVSKAIDQLETAIGSRLFDRTSAHQRSLTRAGELMNNEILSGALHFERAVGRARNAALSAEGECKLVMSEGMATHWFVRYFLGAFQRRHPGVDVKLFTTNDYTRTLLPQFDMQLQFTPVADDNLMTVRLGTFHFLFFASSDFIERHGMPSTIEDVTKCPMAEVLQAPGNQRRWPTFTQGANPVRSAIASNSGSVALEAVQASLCVAQIPSYAYITDKRLVPLVPGYFRSFGLYLNFSKDAKDQPATRVMIDYLKNVVFNKNAMPWFRDELEWPNEAWRGRFARLTGDLDTTNE